MAKYTLHRWGKDAVVNYIGGLKNTFEKISGGNAIQKLFDEEYPEILIAKYRRHIVFYTNKNVEKTFIIAVFHEQRDLTSRLDERLM